MKKIGIYTLTILLFMLLLFIVSCNHVDMPDSNDDSGLNEENSVEGDASEVNPKFKIVDSRFDIPLLPYDTAPDYYVCNGTVYKLFYAYDDVRAFVESIGAVEFSSCQTVGFDFESEDYLQIWIFKCDMSAAQYESFYSDNRSSSELEYLFPNGYPFLFSSVIYRNETKHDCGIPVSAFSAVGEYREINAALFETATFYYKTLEGVKDDPIIGEFYKDAGVLPDNFEREKLTVIKEEGTREHIYTLAHNGIRFASIISCEKLSDEFLDMILCGINVID